MAARTSRAYKLKLSPGGIALFLDCHGRLCRLVGDLLPYGATLRVSVTMLDAMPSEDLASLIARDEIDGLAGQQIRYVGTSPALAVLTAGLADRAIAAGRASAPQTWKIFLAGLCAMRAAHDRDILRAFDEVPGEGQGRPSYRE